MDNPSAQNANERRRAPMFSGHSPASGSHAPPRQRTASGNETDAAAYTKLDSDMEKKTQLRYMRSNVFFFTTYDHFPAEHPSNDSNHPEELETLVRHNTENIFQDDDDTKREKVLERLQSRQHRIDAIDAARIRAEKEADKQALFDEDEIVGIEARKQLGEGHQWPATPDEEEKRVLDSEQLRRQSTLGVCAAEEHFAKDYSKRQGKLLSHSELFPYLMNDVLAAGTAVFGLAPFVCIVDKSIVANASGRQKLFPCMLENFKSLVRSPLAFYRLTELQMIGAVYSITYTSANVTDTYCHRYFGCDPFWPVFFAASGGNIFAGIAKDAAFARMFGNSSAPRAMPLATIALFAMRDALTIMSSFSITPKLMGFYQDKGVVTSTPAAKNLAQVTGPMGMQFATTPLHLYALDLFNNEKHTHAERVKFVRREYVKSVFARCCRIAPAFGFGGIGNAGLRNYGLWKRAPARD